MTDARDPEISAYLDDEMDPSTRADFERARELDPVLAARFERLRDLDARLRTLDGPVGDDLRLAAAIAAKLSPDDASRAAASRPIWPIVLAATLGVAAGWLLRIDLPTPAAERSPPPDVVAPSWRDDPNVVARTSRVMGSPRLGRADSKDSRVLVADDAVRLGDTLATEEGSRIALERRNGDRLWLDENGALAFDESGNAELFQGRVVVASADTQVVALGERRFEVIDGVCVIALEIVPSKSRTPIRQIALHVVRGSVRLADHTFTAGDSKRIVSDSIMDAPPPDVSWFIDFATNDD